MMQALGHIFVSIIVSTAIISADYVLPGAFLSRFIDNNLVETFASIVGFNIAAVIFLLGQLISIEERFADADVFKRTRVEIKHNSYFLLISFSLVLVVLMARPDMSSSDMTFSVNLVHYVLNGTSIALFYLALIAVFEILKAVFILGKNPKNF